MATLGRWRGTNVSLIPNSTTFGAPSNLFGTQVRNDSSAYTFTASTSTLTLPSTGLADGYLFIARFETDDTSNGRFNPSGQIVQASGTGTFVNSPGAGYSRDTSEDRAYCNTWAFVHNPSASSTYQFQWKRDADAATGTTVNATFDVIPFYYNDIGLYTSTSAAMYGGTTPNQVTGWTGTNGTNITLASNAVTCAADNVKYLCFGSQYYEGRQGRTQRWMGWRIGGTKIDYGKSYAYFRTGADDNNGGNFYHMFETATANVVVDQFCYRGDGVAAGQGGADFDGSTPTLGDHAMVIMELNSSAEGFHTIDNTGGVDLNVVAAVDQVLCRTAAITFNDAASFTRSTDTAMDVTAAADIFVAANITAAQEVVNTTSRWTSCVRPTVNGTADSDIFHGNYGRNEQGTQDTFGWGCNVAGFIAGTAGADIGVETLEHVGGEDGGQFEVQPNWSGFLGLNLDTLQGGGGANQYSVTSGQITLGGVQGFFSDTGSIALGDLYRGGGIVPDITENALVPTAGEIQLTDMYGVYSASAADTTPDAFTFTDVTDVAVSTQQTSNTITVAGMDTGASAAVTVTGGTYSKNSGTYTSASGTAQNGDTFSVRHTSSASNSTATNTTLTIGGVSDTYTSTTAASADVTPNAVNWGNISNPNDLAGSTSATISGINTTITLNISFNEQRDGGFCSIVVGGTVQTSTSFTDANNGSTNFTVSNNQTVQFNLSATTGTAEGTATIRNVSDSNATLDTFTYLIND